VNLIFSAKTNANPESSVGLMSMGGTTPEILTTLTTDIGKILDGLHRTKIKGSSHFVTGINVAAVCGLGSLACARGLTDRCDQLALKHRQNKSQKQRIIIFNCSPIEEEEKNLVKLAKKMKKTGISIDIIAFGELSDDTLRKLKAFNDNSQSAEGSHLEAVQPSGNLLSDALVTTPILGGDGSSASAGAGGSGGEGGSGGSGGNDFEFGVDPSVDPELALALRMSFEEEKARQDKEKKAQEVAEGKTELESVAEGDEKQPLLDDQGQPSGSGSKDKKKDEDPDKMDTA
jgi:26S proteasome regulatory subunit N10